MYTDGNIASCLQENKTEERFTGDKRGKYMYIIP
jgi:hypothetical protein